MQGKLQFSFDLILQFDRLGHRQPIRALAMASDDSLLLSGSTESLKLWSCGQKFQLLKSWPAENCIFLKFLPKDRFFVTGSKTGVIRLYDLRSSEVVQTLEAHTEAIWSLDWHEKPAGSQGINLVSGSSDGTVKFWSVLYDKEKKTLKLKISRRIELDESVQWVQYTPDGQYYACALLNHKINIYYSDSDKLFLSLYGHKLPVMCFDISSDNTLLVSASADKNVKIWGMDFGDCHKSIWAHDDSITQVRFVKDTHYFITVSKDKSCKFWDGDKFILVMDWNDHYAEIWALCLSSIGDFFVTGGNDMAMRAYLQGKEQVFANIEENVRQEKAIVQKAFDDSEKHQHSATPDDGPENAGETSGKNPKNLTDSSVLTKRSFESLKYGEEMIEAIETAEKMSEEYQEYEERMREWRKKNKKTAEPKKPEMWKLKNFRSIPEFVMEVIGRTKPTELYSSLKFLHFSHCEKLLLYVRYCLENNLQIELCYRVFFIVLDCWKQNILNSKRLVGLLSIIKELLNLRLKESIDRLGYNLSGIRCIKKELGYLKEETFDFAQGF